MESSTAGNNVSIVSRTTMFHGTEPLAPPSPLQGSSEGALGRKTPAHAHGLGQNSSANAMPTNRTCARLLTTLLGPCRGRGSSRKLREQGNGSSRPSHQEALLLELDDGEKAPFAQRKRFAKPQLSRGTRPPARVSFQDTQASFGDARHGESCVRLHGFDFLLPLTPAG